MWHALAALASLVAPLATAATTVPVIEYYNSTLDHPAEIAALDNGQFAGWKRTGRMFEAYPGPTGNASPVCRLLIPPAACDSHFYSASPTECAQTQAENPTFFEECEAVMYMDLPKTTTEACPAGDIPVYRVWDTASNHRYMVDRQLRAQMVKQGWTAEGYGLDQVVMCAPLATVGAAVPPPCGLASKIQTLELYPEEWLMANSPTCAGFDPAKQAEYQSALQAASQVAGATHGR